MTRTAPTTSYWLLAFLGLPLVTDLVLAVVFFVDPTSWLPLIVVWLLTLVAGAAVVSRLGSVRELSSTRRNWFVAGAVVAQAGMAWVFAGIVVAAVLIFAIASCGNHCVV